MLTIDTARIFEPLLQPSRYKGAWGGRGSGKSHYLAGAVVEHCLLNPGSRIVCIREVQKTLAQSAKLLIENKIQEFGVGSQFRVLYDRIVRDHLDSINGAGWMAWLSLLGRQKLTMLRPFDSSRRAAVRAILLAPQRLAHAVFRFVSPQSLVKAFRLCMRLCGPQAAPPRRSSSELRAARWGGPSATPQSKL